MGHENPRRINEPVDPHGVSSRPPVTRLRAQAAHLQDHPVILMIQPDTVALSTREGALATGDTVEYSVRHHGGRPLGWPLEFSDEAAPGWTAVLDPATDQLLIHFPGGVVFYDGTMPTVGTWLRDVRRAGLSVSVITGPMAALEDVEPILRAGRASVVRVPITIG